MGIKTVDRGCLNQSWTTELAEVWLQLTKLGKFSHARIILRGFYNEQPTWWCRICIFFASLPQMISGPRPPDLGSDAWTPLAPIFVRTQLSSKVNAPSWDVHTNTLIGIEQDVKPQTGPVGCTGSWRKRQMTSPCGRCFFGPKRQKCHWQFGLSFVIDVIDSGDL